MKGEAQCPVCGSTKSQQRFILHRPHDEEKAEKQGAPCLLVITSQVRGLLFAGSAGAILAALSAQPCARLSTGRHQREGRL